jgi:hypothetical protein
MEEQKRLTWKSLISFSPLSETAHSIKQEQTSRSNTELLPEECAKTFSAYEQFDPNH